MPPPTHRITPALALAALLLLLLVSRHANARQDPGKQLAQLLTAEQTAVDSGNPAEILASSRSLADLALRLLATLYTSQGNFARASDTLSNPSTSSTIPRPVRPPASSSSPPTSRPTVPNTPPPPPSSSSPQTATPPSSTSRSPTPTTPPTTSPARSPSSPEPSYSIPRTAPLTRTAHPRTPTLNFSGAPLATRLHLPRLGIASLQDPEAP